MGIKEIRLKVLCRVFRLICTSCFARTASPLYTPLPPLRVLSIRTTISSNIPWRSRSARRKEENLYTFRSLPTDPRDLLSRIKKEKKKKEKVGRKCQAVNKMAKGEGHFATVETPL